MTSRSDPQAWQEALLRGLRESIIDQEEPGLKYGPWVLVQSIELEGAYPGVDVVILYRLEPRPECLFGYRWPAPYWLDDEIDSEDDAELLANQVKANFDESFGRALEAVCESDEIVWVD